MLKKCACGCNGEILEKVRRGKAKNVKFITGHHLKLASKNRDTATLNIWERRCIPKPEEIPNGTCECGCNGKTILSTTTVPRLRQFKGYPRPFILGHASKLLVREKHSNWKGGKTTSQDGYVFIKNSSHPNCRFNGYVAEHRLVMEEKLVRYLKKTEQVHHINGIRNDNRIINLELWDRSHPSGVRSSQNPLKIIKEIMDSKEVRNFIALASC